MTKESLTKTIVSKEPQRVDRLLHSYIGGSRNQVEKLIKKGLVKVAGRVVTKAGYKVSSGDLVEYTLIKEPPKEVGAVNFDVEVIYEDEDILVVNKPSGIVVHPAPSVKEATLVDWLKQKGVSLSTISGDERHGIVHRLDKDTSGALVVAKNNSAHMALSKQLQDRTMGRYYLALIDYPLKSSVTVDGAIGRSRANRLKMDIVPGAKEAKTSFKKILETKEDKRDRFELIAAKLYSGRTHQIRVHLASLGRHIVGDSLYGFKSSGCKIERVLLHAFLLYLKHPVSGANMSFTAPLPDSMLDVLTRYFKKEKLDEVLDPSFIVSGFDNVDEWVRS